MPARPFRDGAIGAACRPETFTCDSRGRGSKATFRTTTAKDGRRIFSFRRLPDLPLVVLVGFDCRRRCSRPTACHVPHACLIGSIVSAIVLLLGALWIVLQRRWVISRRQLRLTLENISQGIVLVDANGQTPVVNRRRRELLGLARDATPGSAIARWPQTSDGTPRTPVAADAASRTRRSGERPRLIREDGKIIEVQSHPTPVRRRRR